MAVVNQIKDTSRYSSMRTFINIIVVPNLFSYYYFHNICLRIKFPLNTLVLLNFSYYYSIYFEFEWPIDATKLMKRDMQN